MFSGFKGGIHPPENKHISEDKPFSNLPVPQTCYIPLQQHIGAPAKAVVQAGDMVTEGQLIGEAGGFVSANIHSPVPGKVTEIKEILTVNNRQLAVVIEAEGAFSTSAQPKQTDDWKILSAEEILKRIRDAGIVGLGGAAFPTAVKLSPPPEKKIDTVVINGSECEPYLTVDDMLMQSFPGEIIEGTQIIMKVLGVNRAIIGIENNKSKAFASLKKFLARETGAQIEVRSLKTKYPQGAEKQLIYSLLKREVPSGALPMEVGVVVQNVGTIFAIREAVLYSKPLFERYITVSGSMINKPGNYKVRFGTKISDIVEECGGLKGEPAKIIIGGPMCGLSVHSMDIPVVKGTSGILFLSEDEVRTGDYSQCIRCGRCVAACPINLLPCDLGNAVEKNRYDLVESLNPLDCIMCGSCSYSCPSKRPLSHFIKLAQAWVRKQKK
jgi:electron transport complex protein RnfC